MSRPPSEILTPREAQIMDLLWDAGETTSEEIRLKLPGTPHDSSVRTILRTLVAKKCVTVNNAVRPARYRAAIPQAKIRKKATTSFLKRFFGGSVEELVQHLLDNEQLTPRQLAALRRQYGSPARQEESKQEE